MEEKSRKSKAYPQVNKKFKTERNQSRIMAKSRATSSNKTISSRDSTQRDHRRMSNVNRKRGSVESYGDIYDKDLRRGEEDTSVERTSGTVAESPISDKFSESGLDWNCSYQGSDGLNYAGLENLRRNLTSAQFWKLTMGCLETRPRMGRKPEDCRTCKGHEYRNKAIMEEAERVDTAQWTRKLFNQVDGVSDGMGSQRSRFPWSMHDEKIKESLKHIAAPRRVYHNPDAGWSGVYEEDEIEIPEAPEEPTFHYLDNRREERGNAGRSRVYDEEEAGRWDDREDAQSQYAGRNLDERKNAGRSRVHDGKDYRRTGARNEAELGRPPKEKENEKYAHVSSFPKEEYSDGRLSNAGGSRRKIGGNDPVTEIAIPDPRKTWKRPEEKSRDMRFGSPDRVAKKPQISNRGMAAKSQRPSPLEKKKPADSGVLANQEALKRHMLSTLQNGASVDRSMISNQEHINKFFLSSSETLKTPEDHGMLTNQEALKRQLVSDLNEASETSHAQRKRTPNKADTKDKGSRAISSSKKGEYPPRETKTMAYSSHAKEPDSDEPARETYSSRKRYPTPGEKNMDIERHELSQKKEDIRSRRPTPYRTNSPSWKQEGHHRWKKEAESKRGLKQEEVPKRVPTPQPVKTVKHEVKPATTSKASTPRHRSCPNTGRTPRQSPPCQRFKAREEGSKKMLLDQEITSPKYSVDSRSSRSTLRQLIVPPCTRFVGHEEKSSLFLQKKHEDEFKLEQESRESCSPKDRHVQSVKRRGQELRRTPSCNRYTGHDEKSKEYLQRKKKQDLKLELESRESRSPQDLHVQSVQRRAQALGTPPCEKFKHLEDDVVRRILPRPEPRTAAAKIRYANAAALRQEVETPLSCDTFTRRQNESSKTFERSESSRESTPGSRGFWDWKQEEKAYDDLIEENRRRNSGRPCYRWQARDERSRVVLEEARTKLEEALKLWDDGCPVPLERCLNCQDKKKVTESLRRWGDIKRDQSSNSSPPQKRS